ncbi:glycosyltransferase family 2 protein [Christiangramia aquimixticola]
MRVITGTIPVALLGYFSITAPHLLEIFLMVISIFMAIIAVSRFLFSRKIKENTPYYSNDNNHPFVSIHLAICNEPPEIVLRTIRQALKIDYPNFEIIVLDNNTSRKELWKPIEDFCNKHPDIIKFRHYDKLDGYKAGALNECLKLIQPETEYIFTLDADYRLKPSCLKIALKEVRKDDFAVVQFPQNYVVNGRKMGLFKELEHFFTLYATGGNNSYSTLPTGTLTFIELKALQSVNGWPQETLTEDARLGIELLSKNFKTRFSSKKVGKGIMPGTVQDLRKQRYRWVYGNTQCLMDLLYTKMNWKRKFSAAMQLLAWINLLAFPIISALLYMVFYIAGAVDQFNYLPEIILLQFGIFITGKLLLMLKNTRRSTFHTDLKAFFIHLALAFEMAFACWCAVFCIPKKFITTNKSNKVSKLSSVPLFIPSILGILTSFLGFQGETLLAIVSLLIFSLFLVGSLYMLHEFEVENNNLKLKPSTP